jgi:hypothetical protein
MTMTPEASDVKPRIGPHGPGGPATRATTSNLPSPWGRKPTTSPLGGVLVASSGPLVPRLRASPAASALVDGVDVASLALVAVATAPRGHHRCPDRGRSRWSARHPAALHLGA